MSLPRIKKSFLAISCLTFLLWVIGCTESEVRTFLEDFAREALAAFLL